MADIKLKPCPFCGGEAVLSGFDNCSYVHCKSCGAEAGMTRVSAKYCSNEKSAEAWNRRVEPEKGGNDGQP